jgi:hypothetical protein
VRIVAAVVDAAKTKTGARTVAAAAVGIAPLICPVEHTAGGDDARRIPSWRIAVAVTAIVLLAALVSAYLFVRRRGLRWNSTRRNGSVFGLLMNSDSKQKETMIL